jgi:hypothetical protein
MIRVGVSVNSFVASGGGGGFDADAQAFFDRVTAAGGTLTTTEKNATNTLVVQMKADGTWTPMKAIYPMVGASAAACAQNLKSSSFTGTFSSGWTFASTGVTGNGTSSYFDTNFIPNANLTFTSASLGFAIATVSTSTFRIDIGSGDVSKWFMAWNDSFGFSAVRINFGSTATGPSYLTAGKIFGSRTANNLQKLYRNGAVVTTDTTTIVSSLPSINKVYIGALNDSGTANYNTNARYTFAFMGDGLSDANATSFNTVIDTFNTTLSR